MVRINDEGFVVTAGPFRDKLKQLRDKAVNKAKDTATDIANRAVEKAKSVIVGPTTPETHTTNFLPEDVRDRQDPNAVAHSYYDFASIVGDATGPDGTQGVYAIADGKSGDAKRFQLPADSTNPKSRFFENGTVGMVRSMGAESAILEFEKNPAWPKDSGLYHFKRENVHQMRAPGDRQHPLKKEPAPALPAVKELAPRQDLINDLYDPNMPERKGSVVVKAGEGFPFFEQCDRLRMNYANGEAFWQEIIRNRQLVPVEDFIKHVNLSTLLDEGETLEEFGAADPDTRYFVSSIRGVPVYYIGTHGFEFIFGDSARLESLTGARKASIIVTAVHKVATKVPVVVHAVFFTESYELDYPGREDGDPGEPEITLHVGDWRTTTDGREYPIAIDIELDDLWRQTQNYGLRSDNPSDNRWYSEPEDNYRGQETREFLEITGLTSAQNQMLALLFQGRVTLDEIVEGGEHEGVVLPDAIGQEIADYLVTENTDPHVLDLLRDITTRQSVSAADIRLLSSILRRKQYTWVDRQQIEDENVTGLLQKLSEYMNQARADVPQWRRDRMSSIIITAGDVLSLDDKLSEHEKFVRKLRTDPAYGPSLLEKNDLDMKELYGDSVVVKPEEFSPVLPEGVVDLDRQRWLRTPPGEMTNLMSNDIMDSLEQVDKEFGHSAPENIELPNNVVQIPFGKDPQSPKGASVVVTAATLIPPGEAIDAAIDAAWDEIEAAHKEDYQQGSAWRICTVLEKALRPLVERVGGDYLSVDITEDDGKNLNYYVISGSAGRTLHGRHGVVLYLSDRLQTMPSLDMNTLKKELTATFGHELVHIEQQQRQSRPAPSSGLSRKDEGDQTDYLSHTQEASAFAWNIARDMLGAGYVSQQELLNGTFPRSLAGRTWQQYTTGNPRITDKTRNFVMRRVYDIFQELSKRAKEHHSYWHKWWSARNYDATEEEQAAAEETMWKQYWNRYSKEASIVVQAEAYHGTRGGFIELDHEKSGLGTHFGTQAAAKDRGRGTWPWEIRKYDLAIKKPLQMPDIAAWFSPESVFEAVNAVGVRTADPQSFAAANDQTKWKYIREAIEKAGYDSIEYKNLAEDIGNVSYIVWNNSLIRRLANAMVSPQLVAEYAQIFDAVRAAGAQENRGALLMHYDLNGQKGTGMLYPLNHNMMEGADEDEIRGHIQGAQRWLANPKKIVQASVVVKSAGPERVQVLKQKYPQLSYEIDVLAEADPTNGQQKYLDWAVRQVVSGQDLDETVDALNDFHAARHELKRNKHDIDINKYDVAKLRETCAPYQYVKIYSDQNYSAYEVKTHKSLNSVGSQQWCVARDRSHFDRYIREHPEGRFVMFQSNTEPEDRYLYWVVGGEVREARDNDDNDFFPSAALAMAVTSVLGEKAADGTQSSILSVLRQHGEWATGGPQAEMAVAAEWAQTGLTAIEIDHWLDAGIYEASTATALTDHGITSQQVEEYSEALGLRQGDMSVGDIINVIRGREVLFLTSYDHAGRLIVHSSYDATDGDAQTLAKEHAVALGEGSYYLNQGTIHKRVINFGDNERRNLDMLRSANSLPTIASFTVEEGNIHDGERTASLVVTAAVPPTAGAEAKSVEPVTLTNARGGKMSFGSGEVFTVVRLDQQGFVWLKLVRTGEEYSIPPAVFAKSFVAPKKVTRPVPSNLRGLRVGSVVVRAGDDDEAAWENKLRKDLEERREQEKQAPQVQQSTELSQTIGEDELTQEQRLIAWDLLLTTLDASGFDSPQPTVLKSSSGSKWTSSLWFTEKTVSTPKHVEAFIRGNTREGLHRVVMTYHHGKEVLGLGGWSAASWAIAYVDKAFSAIERTITGAVERANFLVNSPPWQWTRGGSLIVRAEQEQDEFDTIDVLPVADPIFEPGTPWNYRIDPKNPSMVIDELTGKKYKRKRKTPLPVAETPDLGSHEKRKEVEQQILPLLPQHQQEELKNIERERDKKYRKKDYSVENEMTEQGLYVPKREIPPASEVKVEDLKIKEDGGLKNIIKVLKAARPDEVDYWKDWYVYALEDVKALAQKYNAPIPVVAGLVAALSPNVKWEQNVRAAEGILQGKGKKVQEYRRTLDREAAENFAVKLFPDLYVPRETIGTFSYLTNINKAQRMLDAYEKYGAYDDRPAEDIQLDWSHRETPKKKSESTEYLSPDIARKVIFDLAKRGYAVYTTKQGKEMKSQPGEFAKNWTKGEIIDIEDIARDGLPEAKRCVLSPPISGPKVTAFYNSILRPQESQDKVVLDGHAQNIWYGIAQPLNDMEVTTPPEELRKRMINDYKKAADMSSSIVGQKLSPQQVQAITWSVWRAAIDGVERKKKKSAESLIVDAAGLHIGSLNVAMSDSVVVARNDEVERRNDNFEWRRQKIVTDADQGLNQRDCTSRKADTEFDSSNRLDDVWNDAGLVVTGKFGHARGQSTPLSVNSETEVRVGVMRDESSVGKNAEVAQVYGAGGNFDVGDGRFGMVEKEIDNMKFVNTQPERSVIVTTATKRFGGDFISHDGTMPEALETVNAPVEMDDGGALPEIKEPQAIENGSVLATPDEPEESTFILSRTGHRQYEGEHNGYRIKVRGEEEILHGSYPGRRRQKRELKWVVFVDGEEKGEAPSLREAKQLALRKCKKPKKESSFVVRAGAIDVEDSEAEKKSTFIGLIKPGDRVSFKEPFEFKEDGKTFSVAAEEVGSVVSVDPNSPVLSVSVSCSTKGSDSLAVQRRQVTVPPEKVSVLLSSEDKRASVIVKSAMSARVFADILHRAIGEVGGDPNDRHQAIRALTEYQQLLQQGKAMEAADPNHVMQAIRFAHSFDNDSWLDLLLTMGAMGGPKTPNTPYYQDKEPYGLGDEEEGAKPAVYGPERGPKTPIKSPSSSAPMMARDGPKGQALAIYRQQLDRTSGGKEQLMYILVPPGTPVSSTPTAGQKGPATTGVILGMSNTGHVRVDVNGEEQAWSPSRTRVTRANVPKDARGLSKDEVRAFLTRSRAGARPQAL